MLPGRVFRLFGFPANSFVVMTADSAAQASSSKIEAFLSYAHESDQHLNLAEPLHRDLVGMIHMRSQRDVEIFRDKIDLQWGDRFRAALDNGLSGASVLFVIATTHYLASKSCRDEFNDFLNAAKATGRKEVRRLILPIVPIAAPKVFREDSDDDVAKEIASIQYELIEDAVVAGPGSPEWKRAIIRLADRFIEVVEAAEAEAEEVVGDYVLVHRGSQNSSADEAEHDERGYFDAFADMEEEIAEITQLTERVGELMTEAVAPMGGINFSKVKTAKEMNIKLSTLSKLIQPKSILLGKAGQEVRDKANNIDVSIRHLVGITNAEGAEVLADGLRQFLKNTKESLANSGAVLDQMDGLLSSMAPAEQASSMMRNALKPMRSGIVAVNDAVRIFQKWGPELME